METLKFNTIELIIHESKVFDDPKHSFASL